MSTDTPVWLLDIDGVINAINRNRRDGWPWAEFRRVRIDGYWLNVARPVLAFLNRVHVEGLAEIRWHTTWQERALDVGDLFKLPTFHIAHAPEFLNRIEHKLPRRLRDEPTDWWKLPAALRVVEEEGRRLLWTDDDATELSAADNRRLWARGPGTTMVIAPNPETGLVQTDLDRIDLFLTRDLSEVPT